MFKAVKSTFRGAIAALTFAGLAAGAASAQYFGGDVDVNLSSNDDEAIFAAEANVSGSVSGDLAVFAADISINIDAAGDLAAFGADVDVQGVVMGDAAVGGADVNVGAEVMGDLGVFGADLDISSLVGGELAVAGHTITIDSTAVVNGPTSLRGEDIFMQGRFVGPVDIAGVDVVIRGQIDGGAEIYVRDLTIASDAIINGPITVRGPKPPTVEDGAQVGEIEYIQERFDDSRIERDFDLPVNVWPGFWVVGALWGSAAFILGFFVCVLFPRSLGRMSNRFRARPWVSSGLGLILWATMWILMLTLAVLLAITIIGALLTPFVIFAIPLAYFLAYVFGAVVIGDMIFNRSGGQAGFLLRVGSLLAVLLVLAASYVFPPLGLVVGLVVTFIGFGAWSLAIFDRTPEPPSVANAGVNEAEAV